jgi:hypothetical protein
MSMPSLDFFRSGPATESLRVESEPPGADARTSQDQSCRTPCELTVQSGGEMTVTFSLAGFQPQTVTVRTETTPSSGIGESSGPARMQPNPVYAELTPLRPNPPPKKKPGLKKKTVAKKSDPAPVENNTPDPTVAYPSNYPWPAPPQ